MGTITRYVNTSNSASGDGTTNAEDGGATSAYVSMSVWEAAEQTDLVTDGDSHICECDRGSSTGKDTTECYITGWTNGASNTLTVRGNRSSSTGFNPTGVWDADAYYTIENDDTYRTVRINEGYVTIDGLQHEHTTSSVGRWCIQVSGGSGVEIKNNLVKQTGTGSTSDGIFVVSETANPYIYNNVVTGFNTSSSVGISSRSPCRIYNNTITDCTTGIQLESQIGGSEVVDAKNNLIIDCATDLTDNSSSSAVTFDYNASDDPTSGTADPRGANGVDMNENASSEWDGAVVNLAGCNFRVKDTSSLLYNAGITNASDSNVPTTDLLGVSRSTYDIGAFEFQNTGTYSGALTLSGSLASVLQAQAATLSGDLSISGLLVGVGDSAQAATLSGELTLSGSLASVLQAQAATFGGELRLSGLLASVLQAQAATLSGELALSGSLASVLQAQAATFGGELAFSGSLVESPHASFTGELTLSGSLASTPVVLSGGLFDLLESLADVNALLGQDGEQIQITSDAGTATVSVHWVALSSNGGQRDGPKFLCSTAHLPSDFKQGDTVRRSGVDYNAESRRPDGHGFETVFVKAH